MANLLPFKEFIVENYKNLIGVKSREARLKYADAVWKILQDSYAKIGGIHGSGFESIEDMIEKIPFWKSYSILRCCRTEFCSYFYINREI